MLLQFKNIFCFKHELITTSRLFLNTAARKSQLSEREARGLGAGRQAKQAK